MSYRAQTTNLHLFWDFNVVDMEEGNAEELAKKLDQSITPKQRSEWQSGEPKTWTDEIISFIEIRCLYRSGIHGIVRRIRSNRSHDSQTTAGSGGNEAGVVAE